MEKIEFVNNSEPYLSAENLNQMQSNIEEAIEEKQTYSTEEQVIGEYLGKPLYRKIFTGDILHGTLLLSNIDVLKSVEGMGWVSDVARAIPFYQYYNSQEFALTVEKYLTNEVKCIVLSEGATSTSYNSNIILEYTKTTD